MADLCNKLVSVCHECWHQFTVLVFSSTSRMLSTVSVLCSIKYSSDDRQYSLGEIFLTIVDSPRLDSIQNVDVPENGSACFDPALSNR